MAAATAARSRSATEVWLLGSPNRTPAGGSSFPRTGKCYGASSTSSVCSGIDVENRRSFSLALMTLFDIGHADAFDLITVDEDRQFLLGQRCPDGPRCIMQVVDQSLADRERRRLERGVLKRSSSPERATTATRSSSAWVQATKKRTVVTTDGTRTSFRAQEYPLNRPVPPSVAARRS
ncbi:hypothetical protein GWK47_045904 [Chionoecetes opilio]|uniref:Uncharacterized protein n=1 Tax=Chionoecetes opilio TaxID=41210 RepID=A0A8J4YI16_CHIOP|nr:hypothetical protein GWK47_045904 [Chionoecetes opilio]